jgi:hypothetical protein
MQLGINITNCEYYCCDLETPTLNTVCCFPSDYTWIASIVIPIFVFIVLFFLLFWFLNRSIIFLISLLI